MAFSDEEQRRLEEVERAFDGEDANSSAVPAGDRGVRRCPASSAGWAVTELGVVMVLTGLVFTQGYGAVGLIVLLAGAVTLAGAVRMRGPGARR